MENLSSVDKNFAAQKADQVDYTDVADRLELVHGLQHGENGFFRMEKEIAAKVNEAVLALSANTAGGRLRFFTDSRIVSLRAELDNYYSSANMTLLGTAGFDLYEKRAERWIYRGCYPPAEDGNTRLEAALVLPEEGEHELLLHFPLFAEVKKLELGLLAGASLRPASYGRKEKLLFYGSSITHGGCAGRPGSCYTAEVSRLLDVDYRNLGFSSGARAEETMREYLIRQECDLMVLDYDHNAPDAAYLERTHEKLYRAVRAARPELPIILASAPVAEDEPGSWGLRREIIRRTYENGKAAGDSRLWFLDGGRFYGEEDRENCMVDQWHPNDLGMQRMARAFAGVIETALASVRN